MTTSTSRNAGQCAAYAEGVTSYAVGYCLQFARVCAGAAAKYPDATTASKHADLHGDRNPPRGSICYWTGGSHGYGHAAVSVGNQRIRTTDAPSPGYVSSQPLDWPETHWGLRWAGWAWDVNDQTIPHDEPPPEPEEDPMPDFINAKTAGTIKLKADAWHTIDWDNVTAGQDYIADGSPGVKVVGPYTASLAVHVTDRDGGKVQVQFVEFADGETVETNPVDTLGGVDYGRSTQVGSVADEKGRVLRARVRCSSDATLADASVMVLAFRPR